MIHRKTGDETREQSTYLATYDTLTSVTKQLGTQLGPNVACLKHRSRPCAARSSSPGHRRPGAAGAGLAESLTIGEGEAAELQLHRGVGELDQVRHVGHVVEDQFLECRFVAAAVAVPEADGLEAVDALDRGVAAQPEPALDGLEAPLVAERGQDEAEVDVRLVEPGAGKWARRKGTSNWLPL